MISLQPIAPDSLTPFLLESADVRGRVVRLPSVAHTVLSRYSYPRPIAEFLGELLVVAAMLSSNLKQEGIFTVQVRGNGPVPLLVVDAAYGGQLRGFADAGSAAARQLEDQAGLQDMFGTDAYLAITLDPGAGMQRYQGVVALEGENLSEALGHYFTHSQQLAVQFHLAVDRIFLPGSAEPKWIGAGLMIERLPKEERNAENPEEGWRYATAIASTVKKEELLDPLLDAESLLYRLFHEEGVRVFPPHILTTGCRCSRERIEDLLMSMSLEDRAEMIVDGKASVHCQFCNTTQEFSPKQLGLSVS